MTGRRHGKAEQGNAPSRLRQPAQFADAEKGTTWERGPLDIIIANGSSEPIYEQIASQMKSLIMTGELAEGQQLPSIRALANDLRISVITTKRAYAELEKAGLVATVQGKGTFVAGGNRELLREERLRSVEQQLEQALRDAEAAGITGEEVRAMLDLLLEGQLHRLHH